MQRVTPTLYVLDLGVVERVLEREPVRGNTTVERSSNTASRARAMALAKQIHADAEAAGSLNGAARRLGLTLGEGKSYLRLRGLDPEIQQQVIDGYAEDVSLTKLCAIARLPAEAQRQAFDSVRSVSPHRSPEPQPVSQESPCETDPTLHLRVRVIVAFNPELFVDQRRTARKQLNDIQVFVHELNASLARPRSKRTRRAIEAECDHFLRRRNLLDAFEIQIDERKSAWGTHFWVHAKLDPIRWQRRRRYDGFSVIVAHCDLAKSGAELCQLYRAKDAVEKDFQVIKGLVRLRPIWHYTDAKVRAHVTLCMLALLLERTLNERLHHGSAARAIDTLSTCCLNRFQDTDGKSHYVVTQPDEDQQALLRELKLGMLADDNYVIERLQPR